MCIMEIYTKTFTRLVCMNSLVLLGLTTLLLVVSVRLVPLGFTRLTTLITLVTLVTFPLILFLRIFGIGHTLPCKNLTLRGW